MKEPIYSVRSSTGIFGWFYDNHLLETVGPFESYDAAYNAWREYCLFPEVVDMYKKENKDEKRKSNL